MEHRGVELPEAKAKIISMFSFDVCIKGDLIACFYYISLTEKLIPASSAPSRERVSLSNQPIVNNVICYLSPALQIAMNALSITCLSLVMLFTAFAFAGRSQTLFDAWHIVVRSMYLSDVIFFRNLDIFGIRRILETSALTYAFFLFIFFYFLHVNV